MTTYTKKQMAEKAMALYEEARERVLSPDCADWLECGWLGLEARQEPAR